MKIRTWGSRNMSYAARTVLMNAVLMNLHTYWCFVFVIPKAVIKKINAICSNFLWDGKAISNRSPHVAWESMCRGKKEGGLGIRDNEKWNLAAVGKLVWDITSKADKMWVKWVNHVYMKNQDWWGYQPNYETSWTWRKICKARDTFANGYSGQV